MIDRCWLIYCQREWGWKRAEKKKRMPALDPLSLTIVSARKNVTKPSREKWRKNGNTIGGAGLLASRDWTERVVLDVLDVLTMFFNQGSWWQGIRNEFGTIALVQRKVETLTLGSRAAHWLTTRRPLGVDPRPRFPLHGKRRGFFFLLLLLDSHNSRHTQMRTGNGWATTEITTAAQTKKRKDKTKQRNMDVWTNGRAHTHKWDGTTQSFDLAASLLTMGERGAQESLLYLVFFFEHFTRCLTTVVGWKDAPPLLIRLISFFWIHSSAKVNSNEWFQVRHPPDISLPLLWSLKQNRG